MQALDEAGGELPLRDILHEVESRVPLTDRDREVYEKSGYVRWRSILHFYSIDAVKAGLIRKASGRWILTPEGKAALVKPPEVVLEGAQRAYREWRAQQLDRAAPDANGNAVDPDKQEASIERSLVFEEAEAKALQEIRDHLAGLGGYEFQDLVAALLRGMGYFTPFIAAKGPDGGTDILAYRDPLGTIKPHIRVQVKHRKDNKATREEIAALRGIVRSDHEIALFVSAAGFTNDAHREARHGSVHMELIDLDRFLELWLGHYEKLAEEDKALLRLRRVYFLSPE
jgi:restriction system protein